MDKKKNVSNGIIILIVVFLGTVLFYAFSVWQRNVFQTQIIQLAKENVNLKYKMKTIQDELNTKNSLLLFDSTQIYDYFIEVASECDMVVGKITVQKVIDKEKKASFPMDITLEGSYPHMLKFFEFIKERQFVFTINTINIHQNSPEAQNSLKLTININIPTWEGQQI